MKRIVAVMIVLCFTIAVLAACGSRPVSEPHGDTVLNANTEQQAPDMETDEPIVSGEQTIPCMASNGQYVYQVADMEVALSFDVNKYVYYETYSSGEKLVFHYKQLASDLGWEYDREDVWVTYRNGDCELSFTTGGGPAGAPPNTLTTPSGAVADALYVKCAYMGSDEEGPRTYIDTFKQRTPSFCAFAQDKLSLGISAEMIVLYAYAAENSVSSSDPLVFRPLFGDTYLTTAGYIIP